MSVRTVWKGFIFHPNRPTRIPPYEPPTVASIQAQTATCRGAPPATLNPFSPTDLSSPRLQHTEYHPASDGADAKTPDDFVTVELATHTLIDFVAQ